MAASVDTQQNSTTITTTAASTRPRSTGLSAIRLATGICWPLKLITYGGRRTTCAQTMTASFVGRASETNKPAIMVKGSAGSGRGNGRLERRWSLSLPYLLPLACWFFAVTADAAPYWSSFWPTDEASGGGDDQEQEDDDGAISELVSPVVNREIEASVVAPWPDSPHNVFCEALKYHQSSDSSSSAFFLDRLVSLTAERDNDEEWTFREAIDVALQASSSLLTKRAAKLLEYSLHMRASSPACELYRGLARQALLRHDDAARQSAMGDAVAVVHPPGKVIAGEDLGNLNWQALAEPSASEVPVSDTQLLLLPDEVPRGEVGDLVILYANLGSAAFARTYEKLVESRLRFVVRHLGDVYFEEEQQLSSSSGRRSVVVLQGYGVRLDIRNVEYKVFDDRSEGSGNADHEHDGMLNVTAMDLSELPRQLLAGVNLTALLLESDDEEDGESDHQQLHRELWKIHHRQQLHSEIIPPVWQRRHLPMQAASAVASSRDPLVTLQDVSQNLPSLSSTLVHVKVPDEIRVVAEHLAPQLGYRSLLQPGRLFINGGVVVLDRPTFNVFELLNRLRKEQTILDDMQTKFGPLVQNNAAALRSIQKAWMAGEEFGKSATRGAAADEEDDEMDEEDTAYRIDVGRGWKQAVIYLNDVEKDAQYAHWSRSLRQMLMNMQFGQPPAVRRNLFTILAVVDPLHPVDNVGFGLGLQLITSSYPARVGFLLVNDEDIQACADWLSSNAAYIDEDTVCPVSPIVDKKATLDDMKKVHASAHAVHRLVSRFAAEESSQQPGALPAYGEFLLSKIREHLESSDSLTMYDLVSMHGDLTQGMQISSPEEGLEAAIDMLKDVEDTAESEHALYGKALRFAVDKAVKPGMSFLNGRPLPNDPEDESTNKIFGEEQQHVLGLIVKGEITDTSPKSVYAKLLSGNRVFKRTHPLLTTGSEGPTHLALDDDFFADSFLPANDFTPSAEANFVVDAFLEFDTPKGLELASKLMSTMQAFPTSIKSSSTEDTTTVGLSYRILPSTESAANNLLCPVFAYASIVGAPSLLALIKKAESLPQESSVQLAELLSSVQEISAESRVEILSRAASGNRCSSLRYLDAPLPDKNVILANGRIYAVEGTAVEMEDIQLLLSLEMKRAKAVTSLLRDHVTFKKPAHFDVVSRVATFLAIEEKESKTVRYEIDETISSLEEAMDMRENPLHFSWNTDASDEDGLLQMQITAVVDPVSESAQRLAPLLRVIRDQLKLSLTLILAPAPLIDGDAKVPITSYYRLVADPKALPDSTSPHAHFSHLPSNHVLTVQVDVPEPWNVQQTSAVQDTDNLRCDTQAGCGDDAYSDNPKESEIPIHERGHTTKVEYGLKNLLIFGQCYETKGTPPNGLQLTLARDTGTKLGASTVADVEIGMDGAITSDSSSRLSDNSIDRYSDTLVMKNVGYWQLRANPGVWKLSIAEDSKGAEIFEMIEGTVRAGRIVAAKGDSSPATTSKTIFMNDFVSRAEILLVKRREGFEKASLFDDPKTRKSAEDDGEEVINVFSLATGHLYERFLKIMMLSVTKRTSSKVKFWLFENFLSPTFKASARAMAERIGCEVDFVTYKWPEWLRGQSEKQRIIWGYKILFLDVLFPLSVKKIIFVDADQVIRGDLKELWDMDLKGAPYGYTPFCTSREETLGYQFWREGFWKNHLRGKPYHISALYVVDLERFRRTLVGDQLRSIYQQLSADPNSLANLDQDLPNYAQHQVPIFSLPQEWLWCESWCSDETKATAKTIDLCNNPMHKEPKVSMAKRVISGPLFNESWVELDAEVERYEQEYRLSLSSTS